MSQLFTFHNEDEIVKYLQRHGYAVKKLEGTEPVSSSRSLIEELQDYVAKKELDASEKLQEIQKEEKRLYSLMMERHGKEIAEAITIFEFCKENNITIDSKTNNFFTGSSAPLFFSDTIFETSGDIIVPDAKIMFLHSGVWRIMCNYTLIIDREGGMQYRSFRKKNISEKTEDIVKSLRIFLAKFPEFYEDLQRAVRTAIS